MLKYVHISGVDTVREKVKEKNQSHGKVKEFC